jgi:hypothetical protein
MLADGRTSPPTTCGKQGSGLRSVRCNLWDGGSMSHASFVDQGNHGLHLWVVHCTVVLVLSTQAINLIKLLLKACMHAC